MCIFQEEQISIILLLFASIKVRQSNQNYNNMSQPRSQKLLYQLVNTCIQLQKNYNKSQSLEMQCNQLHIPQLLKLIDFQQIGIQKDRGITRGIGLCNIYERFPLRITVYYLPQGQTMKLHDHPGIEVVNYLFSGTMQARLYTHIQDNLYRKQVMKVQKGSIRYIDGERDKEYNLHQFYAIESSYFLDIIFPDYDDQRVCRFYEQEEKIGEEKTRLKEVMDYDVEFTYML